MPPRPPAWIPGRCRALLTQSPLAQPACLPAAAPRLPLYSGRVAWTSHSPAAQLRESEGRCQASQGRAAPAWGHTPKAPGQGTSRRLMDASTPGGGQAACVSARFLSIKGEAAAPWKPEPDTAHIQGQPPDPLSSALPKLPGSELLLLRALVHHINSFKSAL